MPHCLLLRIILLMLAFAGLLSAAIVPASFTSATTVPVSASSYTATGNSLDLSLSFAPERGTNLTVVNVSGRTFIFGRFSNLAHGQRVHLLHNNIVYHFIADYYGGDGNDLVLQWAFRNAHSWGENTTGQLGNTSPTLSRVPVAVQSVFELAGKTPVALAAGAGHSLMLCADGTLAAWGLNGSGQIGINSATFQVNAPARISGLGALANKTVVAIAAGYSHSLALCSDGTIAAWGANNYGQLGTGSYQTRATPTAVPAAGALAGKSVVAIAAGGLHSLAFCSDGSVAAWGDNSHGQLGDGTTVTSPVPVSVSRSNLANGTIRSIAAGGEHSVAVLTNEGVATWGDNWYGQLGGGGQFATPTLIPKNYNLIAASAGGRHTLAISSQGLAVAWGNNARGQLGTSNFTDANSSVAVSTSGALSGKSVTRIAAGGFHSLALCSDGTLAAWGSNQYGQVGNNSSSDRNSPIAITTSGTLNGKTPVAITAGDQHSLAIAAENVTTLTDDAALVTLTSNTGTWIAPFISSHTSYSITVPTTTSSISFTPRTANPSATVRVNGTLVTSGSVSAAIPLFYGSNTIFIDGAATDGITTKSYYFFVTRTLPSTDASLASLIPSTGTLSPSFNTNTGTFRISLPEETSSLTLTPTTTEPNATLTLNATPLASGATSAPIALNYGENRIVIRVTAQDGITTRTTTIIAYRAIPPASQLIDLTTGSFTLSPAFHPARTRYAIAVPHGTTTFSLFPSTLPETLLTVQGSPVAHGENPPPIPLSSGVNPINLRTTGPGGIFTDYEIHVVRSADIEFTFTNADQPAAEFPAFHATGLNARLTLGFTPPAGTSLTVLRLTGLTRVGGRFENLAHGQPVTLIHEGTAHPFIADYAGGDGNDLVLHPADRQLLTWGSNSWGQLGIGNNTDSPTATQVVTNGVLSGKPVIGVTIGGAHTVVHSADGTLAAWGQNSLFQLGTGNNTNRNFPVAVLSQPALAGIPVATRSGGSHTHALCLDGTLASWGANSSGQFGNGTTTSSNVAVAPNTSGALAGKSLAAIAASSTGALALCTDGNLVAWGSNSHGQLGNGTTTNSTVPVPVDTSGFLSGKTVVQIASGQSSSYVLCSDGSLVSWGQNDSGRLGNGGTTNATVPTPVDTSGVLAGKTIVQIAAGAGLGYALCSDGTLAGWGYNFTGQLGDGTKINRHSPVPIPHTGALVGKSITSILVRSGLTLVTCTDGSFVKWSNDAPSVAFETPGIPADRSIVAIGTNNSHHAVIAAAASAPGTREYDLWLARYPTLADPDPLADSDGDGIVNLMESLLGGNPAIRDTAILPTATLNNGNLIYQFHLRENSLTEIDLVFQHCADLTTWQDIHLTDPRVTLGPTNAQGLRPVTITLPAEDASLFTRLKATGP
jgi:alpha-tubulin suppressor-like RCC1 family protein